MKGRSGVGSEDVGTVWNCLHRFCEVIHWPSVSTRLSSFLTDVESSRVSVGAIGQFLMCLLLSLHPSSYSFLASASPPSTSCPLQLTSSRHLSPPPPLLPMVDLIDTEYVCIMTPWQTMVSKFHFQRSESLRTESMKTISTRGLGRM